MLIWGFQSISLSSFKYGKIEYLGKEGVQTFPLLSKLLLHFWGAPLYSKN